MGGLFKKKAQSSVDQRYNALQLNQSTFGNPVPLVYGRTRIPGQLGWYGAFTAIPHTERQGGGKGGGGGASTTSFTYTTGLVLLLHEGPGSGVSQVWSDKQQLQLSDLGLSYFSGASGQAPWSFLTTNFPSQAIGYDHTVYVANGAFNLGGNAALPNLTFEVTGFAANPATAYDAEITDIIIDYLGDANHGALFSYLGTIQGAGATTMQTYCIANGFFISPAETTQRPAVEFLRELLQIANCEAVWSAGVLNIVPYGNESITGNGRTYTPNLTPIFTFTDDDYCPDKGEDPVVTTRKPAAQTYNCVRVEFCDRSNQYNVAIAEAKDDNDIALNGQRTMPTVSLHSITTVAVARNVAQLLLQRQLYVRNTFEFKVRADYSLLEPMDLVAINDSAQGIVNQLVRIVQIDDDEDDAITITAEEMPVGPAAAPLYDWQASAGYAANYAAAPGAIATPLIFALPSRLSDVAGRFELACAVTGTTGSWGGCDVYMSFDNTTYVYAGTIYGPARYGTLRSNYASHSDPDDTNTLQLQLVNTGLAMASGTTADEDNLVTLMYVDSEIVAYRTATLVGSGQYDLTHVRRGRYNSTIALHATSSKWARIDSAIFRVPFDPGAIGSTVYLKFPSFNIYGQAHESVAGVSAYSYVIKNVDSGMPIAEWKPVFDLVTQTGVSEFTKTGGTAGWAGSVYSAAGFTRCMASARAADTLVNVAIGFSATPAANNSFTFEYALILSGTAAGGDGKIHVYEGGVLKATGATFAAGDLYAALYDGTMVRYYHNNTKLWETAVPTPNTVLFLDTSFYDVGAKIKELQFGPIGNVGTFAIDLDATSKLDSATTSTFTITHQQHSPDGQAFNDTIVSQTVTPVDNCDILVTVTCYVTYAMASAHTFADFQYSIQQDSTYDGFQERHAFFPAPAATDSFGIPISVEGKFTGVKGVATTLKFMAAQFNSDDVVTVSNTIITVKQKLR